MPFKSMFRNTTFVQAYSTIYTHSVFVFIGVCGGFGWSSITINPKKPKTLETIKTLTTLKSLETLKTLTTLKGLETLKS